MGMKALALTTLLVVSACNRQQPRAVSASAPVAVAASVITVAAEPFAITIPVTGTLVSNTRVDVKAEVIGRVTRFDKEEGARVKAGEPVVWVNDENYQLLLRQAEMAVKVAEAGVERACLLQSHSRAELERAENLLKSGGITDKDLKATRLAERDAAAQVTLAEAQLAQARAALDVAGKRVRDTVIHAPVAGEIQRKVVNPGAYVEAPTHLFTIVDNSRLELESPVAAADLAPIRAGQRVTFTVNSYPGATFAGRVIEMNPAVDEQTRSAKVRVEVINAGGKLKAGMFAEGEILTGVNGSAVVIPAGAVYRDDRSAKASYVFVLENGKAARRSVRIGHERDSRLEITEGLRPGDQVIGEQNIEIAEGVRVEARR
jgi:membrane fusion protein, multidrug efflux system